jgi:hypothetical protein
MKTYGSMEVRSHTIKSSLLGGHISDRAYEEHDTAEGKKKRNELLQKSSKAWINGCPEKSLFLFESSAIITFMVPIPDS